MSAGSHRHLHPTDRLMSRKATHPCANGIWSVSLSGMGSSRGTHRMCSRPAQAWRPPSYSLATQTCRSMIPRTVGVVAWEGWPGSGKDPSRSRPADRRITWFSFRCNSSGWGIVKRWPFLRWSGICPVRRGPSSTRARTMQITGADAVQGRRTWVARLHSIHGRRSGVWKDSYVRLASRR